jgi:solute carrier family 25 uncoupling protein 8/9
MVGALRLIVREEGARALYKGLWPALHRQLVFASLRIGLYKEISALFLRPGETSISLDRKVLSGLLSGAIGITVANPTDLVKVRMQSDRARPGQAPRYAGVMAAYSGIVRAEGVRGLWTGLGPAVLRNSVINATELASYETAKEALMRDAGMRDGVVVQALAGAAAGVMATLVGNPVDVIKTRVMAAQAAGEAGAGAGPGASAGGAAPAAPRYRGALDCLAQTLRHEGPLALYQGVTPMFVRLTGWSIVMFLTFEQLKLAVARVGIR